jgi:glycosyltransferase involved in cell wall biosynthesis
MSKIVHFGKYYFPDAGGVESVTLSLAKGAVASGHRVDVVCFKKSVAQDGENLDGVQIWRAPIAKLIASQPLGWTYVTHCLREARKADVVHMHAPNMLAALCCLIMSRKPRLLVHWHSDVVNKGLFGLLSRPLEFALLKRADQIVATSQVYADASETLRAFKEKIQVVPIGINAHAGTASREALPDELAERIKGKRVVLSVGRLVPYKGFNVLIRAARLLPADVVVVIVGGGPLKDELDAAIDDEGVSNRVCMAGRLSNDALAALFARATLYCMPSTYRAEAFGVVLLEAMACALPIVATDIPGSGVPWVNKESVSGLNVPVENPVALANACNQILDSEQLRKRLSDGARERYLNEFTEQVSVGRMLQTYAHLGK